jgi:hypothetical protein
MINSIPNKEKVIQTIAEIEGIDLSTATVAQIQSLLSVLLDGFSTIAINIPARKYIHRTRKWTKPDNIRQVTYPTADRATLGRANDQGTPRFYGSIGRNVPFFELNPQIGDTMILSSWRTTNDMLLNRVGFTKESSLLLNSKRDLEKIYTSSEYLGKMDESQVLINNFLAKWFVKQITQEESHFYKITSAIANILLAGDVYAGLIYPTVKMFGNADNLVLDTKFVNKSLELVSIEYLEVTENAGVNFKTELLDTSVQWDEMGNIEWSGRELGWNYPVFSTVEMKGENSEWVNLDRDGHRIDPVPTNLIWRNPPPIGLKYKNCYPQAFKASSDFALKDPETEFNIKFSIIYDVEKKEKFLAFYIPKCRYPIDTAKALGKAYNHFMDIGSENIKEITSTNKNNGEDMSVNLFADGKFMHFFSEEYIDAAELGRQLISGYRLQVEMPRPPLLQINYIYKPCDK